MLHFGAGFLVVLSVLCGVARGGWGAERGEWECRIERTGTSRLSWVLLRRGERQSGGEFEGRSVGRLLLGDSGVVLAQIVGSSDAALVWLATDHVVLCGWDQVGWGLDGWRGVSLVESSILGDPVLVWSVARTGLIAGCYVQEPGRFIMDRSSAIAAALAVGGGGPSLDAVRVACRPEDAWVLQDMLADASMLASEREVIGGQVDIVLALGRLAASVDSGFLHKVIYDDTIAASVRGRAVDLAAGKGLLLEQDVVFAVSPSGEELPFTVRVRLAQAAVWLGGVGLRQLSSSAFRDPNSERLRRCAVYAALVGMWPETWPPKETWEEVDQAMSAVVDGQLGADAFLHSLEFTEDSCRKCYRALLGIVD